MSEGAAEAPSNTPIPGLRVMAVVRWVLLALVASVAALTWIRYPLGATETARGPARYHCPMHPQITSDRPGACPICSMSLEPIEERHASAHGHAMPDTRAESDEARVPVMLTVERRQLAGIATTTAQRVELAGELRAPALVELREGARAEVRVRADGFVERVLVGDSGLHVHRGQALATIVSPDMRQAESELLAAARWPSATGPNAQESAIVLAARTRLSLLGRSDREVDAVLARGTATGILTLRAPIDGVITAIDLVRGGRATADMRLYEITDETRMRIVATVPSMDAAALTAGTRARFEQHGGETTSLTFDLVEPRAAEHIGAIRVRYLGTATALVPGQIGEVVVDRVPRSALVVPRDAVLDTGRVARVFVERDGTFEPRVVEVGALVGEQREVIRGLAEGERVVSRGAFVVDAESRLEAALAPAASSTAPELTMPATGRP